VSVRPVELDMTFASMGGEGPTPYEVLLHAVVVGDASHFARQDSVEETWRILQPLLDDPPPVETYPQGSWRPGHAVDLAYRVGGWREPWLPK
jgi:glucose-6-phosphate 1-dehydrogenase